MTMSRTRMLDAINDLEAELASCAAYLNKGGEPDRAMARSALPVLRRARQIIAAAERARAQPRLPRP